MINLFGKTLAFIHVTLSLALMVMALGLYFNAVDFGWKQPARYFREDAKSKGSNLLIASQLDKREAAMRQLVRVREDQLAQVGFARDRLTKVDTALAENHLEGQAILTALESAEGALEVRTVQYTDTGLTLKPGDPRIAFPALPTVIKECNMSYSKYLDKLKSVDGGIKTSQENLKKLQADQEELTKRVTGKLDDKGKAERDPSGSVLSPGWIYLTEEEARTQKEIEKELEYLQPLWVKELVDAQMVVTRRDQLLRRLQELGDTGVLTQSQFLNKK